MLKSTLLLCALALAASASHAADNCDTLRAQIETNIAAKGVSGFTLSVVDAAAVVPGQVVGQCGNGAKKIVYARGSGAPGATPVAAPAAPRARPRSTRETRDEDILTECRDGSVSVGGRCKD